MAPQLGLTTQGPRAKLPWAYIPAIGSSKRTTTEGPGLRLDPLHTPSRRKLRHFWVIAVPLVLHIQPVAHTRTLMELYVLHVCSVGFDHSFKVVSADLFESLMGFILLYCTLYMHVGQWCSVDGLTS